MPAKSEKQRKFFGAVMGAKKGKKNVSGKAKETAKSMSKEGIKHFLKKEEDEEKPSKEMKSKGKITMKGPQVKERKRFAPANQVHKAKKGKGSYDRSKEKQVNESKESKDISKFIESLITKNYAEANKYLKQVVSSKIEKRIEDELNKPLFDK